MDLYYQRPAAALRRIKEEDRYWNDKKLVVIYLGIAVMLLVPNFLHIHPVTVEPVILPWEQFDYQLAKDVNSIDKLVAASDAHAVINKLPQNGLAYWDNLARITRNSFQHGYSYYSLQENWIAAVAGKLFNSHLAAIVDPDHIMQYTHAACSQQSIVMMACMKRKGIAYRPVLLEGHYALEAHIDGHWRYFDTNLEPQFPGGSHVQSLSELKESGGLQLIYGHILSPARLASVFEVVRFGPQSSQPAPNALLFHRISRLLSLLIWILPALAAARICCRIRKQKQSESTRRLIERVMLSRDLSQLAASRKIA